jgi:hypothetical protein
MAGTRQWTLLHLHMTFDQDYQGYVSTVMCYLSSYILSKRPAAPVLSATKVRRVPQQQFYSTMHRSMRTAITISVGTVQDSVVLNATRGTVPHKREDVYCLLSAVDAILQPFI